MRAGSHELFAPLRHYEFRYLRREPFRDENPDPLRVYCVIVAHDAADALVQFNAEMPTGGHLERIRPLPGYDVWVHPIGGDQQCGRGCCTRAGLGFKPVRE